MKVNAGEYQRVNGDSDDSQVIIDAIKRHAKLKKKKAEKTPKRS